VGGFEPNGQDVSHLLHTGKSPAALIGTYPLLHKISHLPTFHLGVKCQAQFDASTILPKEEQSSKRLPDPYLYITLSNISG
jgi:hypothetical protein